MYKQVIKRLCQILMAVQILFGMVWGVLNMVHMQQFHDTQWYIRAAETFVIDEYMGILYPLLIAFAKRLEAVVSVPFYSFLYVLQLSVAFAVTVRFLKCMGWIHAEGRRGKIFTVFGALYGVTFPLLMQLHMAVLPYSLAGSVLILLIGEGIVGLREDQELSGKRLICLCGLWLTSYLLLPEYGFLSGVPICVIFFRHFRKNRKCLMRLVMALLSTVLCFGVVAKSTQVPGSMGRMQKTVGAAMVQRFVWPYFLTGSYFWDDRVKALFDVDELLRFAGYPEAVLYEFGPELEGEYGREEADKIYRDMALTSLKLQTKESVLRITEDAVSNLCPQGALQWQLGNRGTTLNSWNYGQMQEKAIMLTKYYVRFSLAGWSVMCILYLLGGFVRGVKRLKRKQREFRVLCFGLLFFALWYTMSSSMQDYKKVMFAVFVWLLPVMKIFLEEEE